MANLVKLYKIWWSRNIKSQWYISLPSSFPIICTQIWWRHMSKDTQSKSCLMYMTLDIWRHQHCVQKLPDVYKRFHMSSFKESSFKESSFKESSFKESRFILLLLLQKIKLQRIKIHPASAAYTVFCCLLLHILLFCNLVPKEEQDQSPVDRLLEAGKKCMGKELKSAKLHAIKVLGKNLWRWMFWCLSHSHPVVQRFAANACSAIRSMWSYK